MTRKIGFLLIAILLSSCSTLHSQQISYQSEAYTLVTGSQLDALVVGKAMRRGKPSPDEIYVPWAISFEPDGRYIVGRHRVGPAFGTYEVKADRVCTVIKDVNNCFQVFQNDDGMLLHREVAEGAMPKTIVLEALPSS